MKLYLDDIKKISWLRNAIENSIAPGAKAFLNTKKGFYFVFNYKYDSRDSVIHIQSHKYLYEINDTIYTNMQGDHVGYLREPFDTSNYLFYSMLACFCDTHENIEKLDKLFLEYKAKDIQEAKSNLKVLLKANMSVTNRIDFSEAINKIFSIKKNPINGICAVYDLIDQYTRRKHGKTIYGELLTGFVKAVKNPNGGLMPEYPGSTMRYLIIGEVAAGSDDEDLKKAKLMLRSGSYPNDIYLETGWYYNRLDSKWRKRISDDTFEFMVDKLSSDNNGGTFYKQDDLDEDSFKTITGFILSGSMSMEEAIMQGYNARIGDYISFSEAYKYYPELKNVFSVFLLNFGSYNDFYFSDSGVNSLVLAAGRKSPYNTIEQIKYVALHEIQHYVQRVEDFGTGGNDNIAKLIDVVGGASVRDYIISLDAFISKFRSVASLIDISEYQKLVSNLSNVKHTEYEMRHNSNMVTATKVIYSIVSSLEDLTKTVNKINNGASSIGYYLVTLYALIPETNELIDTFITKHLGADYINIFKISLAQNKKALEKEGQMIKKGWTARDLYMLNFQVYESLMGEVESRFTQNTTRMPRDLRNYFQLYSSESVDVGKINVVNNSIFFENSKAEAAIETKDGKYTIHYSNQLSNSINILHETAHMLYDFEKETVESDIQAFKLALQADKTLEEYFCASFVDYIHRKNIDPMLTADLERTILNYNHFDSLFDSMLFSEMKVDEKGLIERLSFMNKLLEHVGL